MSASEAWKKLNQAINVCHYIGPKAKAEIDNALAPKPKAAPIKKTKASVEGS